MITVVFLLLLSILTLTGCGSNEPESVYVPNKAPVVLNLWGNVNLNNITFPTKLCGNNDYKFRDLSVFEIKVIDEKIKTEVSENGHFSLPEISPKEQILIQCRLKNNPNLFFEWMGASSKGLSGNLMAEITLRSTAQSFIAKALRDRYGRRVNPSAIPDTELKTTIDAITEVIENNPEYLTTTELDQIDAVKSAYTKKADGLANGGSGAYPSEHIFLFYMAGDNDLAPYMESTVTKIAKSEIPQDCEVIIALDTSQNLPLLNKRGAARYRINSTGFILLNDFGELDSSDSSYLQKFVEVSMREYPAKGYSLILNSHGGVWRDKARAGNSSMRAAFMNDFNSTATGTVLNAALAIETALKNNNATNRKFDMIVLDSCNLGSIETAYEFYNLADYTLFSQALMPATGIPYDCFFNELSKIGAKNNYTKFEKAKLLAEQFRTRYVKTSGVLETGITVVDNSKMPYFIDRLNAFFSEAWDNKSEYLPVFYNIRTSKTTNDGEESTGSVIQAFSNTAEFIDLKQFVDLCKNDKQMYYLNDEYNLLEPEFAKLLPYHEYSHSLKGANGISITFPTKEIYQYYYISKIEEGKPLQPRAEEYFRLKFNSSNKFKEDKSWADLLDYMMSK